MLGKIVMHLLCNLESLHLYSAGAWHNGAVGSVAASVLQGSQIDPELEIYMFCAL